MPRVICDLPNASLEISGVKFFPLEEGGVISDEISDEQTAAFLEIPGYVLDEEVREAPKVEAKPAPTTRKGGAKKAVAEPVVEQPAPVETPAPVEPEQPAEDKPAQEEVF